MKRFFIASLAAMMGAACALSAPAVTAADPKEDPVIRYRKVTSILLADAVAPCVDFWTALGMTATVTVPEGDGLGFAILTDGTVELMYQSFTLARAQTPEAVDGVQRSIVFLEVASLDAVLAALPDAETVVPDHVTDYGAREVYVRDPAGNLVGFSEPARTDDDVDG